VVLPTVFDRGIRRSDAYSAQLARFPPEITFVALTAVKH
jgi:hypothetical protein